MAKLKTITKNGTLEPIAVENHGVSPQVKADIAELKNDVSELQSNVDTLETDIQSKANKTEIPSIEGYATETWVEGKNYLTSQDISNLATKSEVEAVDDKVDAVNNLVEAISIPTKVSDLENDSEFQTKSQVETIATGKAAAKVAEIVNGAPEDFDTLKEIADALADNDDAVAGIVTTLTTKANSANVYDKEEVDGKLTAAATAVSNTYETKANATATYATKTAIADMLTKTEAADTYQPKGDYLTEHQPLTAYAKTADVNTELAKKLDVTTHNTDKTALETAIGTKANSADVYTKTAADGKFETIVGHDADKAEIDAAIALCETKADHKKDYDAIMSRLDDVAQTYSLYGMARVNGDTDPKGSKFFGNESNLKQIAGICHIGLVDGNGKLYKRCANGRIDLASDGTELYIDGSDGDVMVYIDSSIYVCRFTDIIEGTEMNVFALGLAPFSIEGHPAKEIKPFAFSPQYTVVCKLDATNTAKGNGSDKRECAHSIYNENVAGSYATPNGSFKNNSFKPNGKKYPKQNVNSMQSIWQGQSKNEVATTNRPFMGGYYEFTEIWLMLMMLENKVGGTDGNKSSLYHQALDNFGCGCTMSSVVTAANFCTEDMAGNSGVKVVIPSEGGQSTILYPGLMSDKTINNTYPLGALVGNTYYGFTEMLETQRLLNDIAKAGLVNKIWKQKGDDANKSIIFEYDSEGKVIVSSKTVADITDGSITPGKKYYQVRNTKACVGMENGVMTAVTNTFIRFDFNNGIKYSSDVTEKDLTGGYAIYKFSRAIYRGMSLSFEGMFTQMQGCHYVRVNATKEWNPETKQFDGAAIAENTNKIYSFFKCVENVDDCPALASDSVQYFGNENEETVMEQNLSKSMLNNTVNSTGWCKKANYNYSLFNMYDYSAGISSGECSYLWNNYSWGNGDTGASNQVPKGRKCVNAVVVGCRADNGVASARTVVGSGAVSYGDDGYAGRFSLPHLTF